MLQSSVALKIVVANYLLLHHLYMGWPVFALNTLRVGQQYLFP